MPSSHPQGTVYHASLIATDSQEKIQVKDGKSILRNRSSCVMDVWYTRGSWKRSHQSSQDALLNLVCLVSSEKEITTSQEPMDCHCAFKSHSCTLAMTLYLHWKLFNLVIYSTSPLMSDGSFRVTMCRTELLSFPSGSFSRYRFHLSWMQGQPWHHWSPWHLCLPCFLLACC